MTTSTWALYEQHAPAIRAYAARRVESDAVDDVVAETFAVAWRRLPREADPLPWLYGVARKVVHGHRRSHARRTALLRRVRGRVGPAAPDPADLVTDDPALARAFARLTEKEREALCLVAWEGLGHAAAARAAGCTENAFAVRLSRGRARLKAALEEAAPPAEPPAPDAPDEPMPANARPSAAPPAPAAARSAALTLTSLEPTHDR